MRCRIVIGGLSLFVVVHAAPSECRAQPAADLAVIIRLIDDAGVTARVLHAAKEEVQKTFSSAGVRIVWTKRRPNEEGTAGDEQLSVGCRVLTVLIVAGPPADSSIHHPVIEGVVGDAVQSLSQARVFYRRLAAASAPNPVDVSVVLGHVISHELGHLLLPPRSHAAVGIMRPGVEFRQTAVRRFTEDQSSLIRTALSRRP